MNIVDKRLDELTPYENNPRINDNAVEPLVNSIREFGFKVPIVIDSNGVIVAGHTRYKAAQELGLETVPCIIADDLTDEQIKAFRLVDNKTGELATWDEEKLKIEIFDLQTFPLVTFGFDKTEQDGDEDDEPNISTGTSFNYEEQYGVIVMCTDEAEQEKIYTRLTDEGFECKVVAT